MDAKVVDSLGRSKCRNKVSQNMELGQCMCSRLHLLLRHSNCQLLMGLQARHVMGL